MAFAWSALQMFGRNGTLALLDQCTFSSIFPFHPKDNIYDLIGELRVSSLCNHMGIKVRLGEQTLIITDRTPRGKE